MIMHEGRKYVRHPTSVPIEVWEFSQTEHNIQQLNNVGLGGLAFDSEVAWEIDSLIAIRVLMEPLIILRGKVVWCHNKGDHFEVGVQFLELQNEVVEEVCQIEIYQKLIREIVSSEWNDDDDDFL
ncbi:MAG: PilZ domain-containing protein [Thioploca sp.]|nr:PilZ domain-containing protein [Thioploca sp.]